VAEQIVVAGAGLAGLRTVEELRSIGYDGSLSLIGAESRPPYDRPPLSKQFLAGTWGLDRVQLRSPDKIDALGLDLRLGRRATTLDVEGHRVVLDDGEVLIETVYRFKGQASPCVILTEVDFASFDERARRKLFVGMTRASMRLFVVLSDAAAAQLIERAEP